MGRIIQQNNGKTTVYVTGENFNALTATTNTYFLGVDLNSGVFEKKNPNGSVINLEASGGATFTGGTIVGATNFTNGLTANTFSATTYLNLPVDSFTGGTVAGATNFTNGLTANTFSATTYLNLPAAEFTGGTVNGATNFTNGLSATTISATTYLNLPVDTFTGGTVNGATNFTNSLSANTFSATTYLNLPVDLFTGGTVAGATNFTNGLTANTFSATTYLNLPADIYITGGTYSAGTLTLSRTILSNIEITGFTNNTISVTYSELVSGITNSTLLVGSFYLITDYQTCYDQPDFDYGTNPITSGNYKQGPVEPLMVLATSVNTISTNAYQPEYPNDKITYDWSFSATEITSNVAFGRITERIDEFNNRTDYDHRNILFKRYRLYTYRLGEELGGTIELLSGGVVSGTTTSFTSLSVGDVIYVDSVYPSYFEITNITDDFNMVISGDTLPTGGPGLTYYLAVEETNGGGQYFSYTRPNVKSGDFVEYTTFGDAILNNYAKNNYIGNYANMYPNTLPFILPNNVFLYGTISNNIFNDYCYNNTFGYDMYGNTFDAYFKENVLTTSFNYNKIGNNFNNNIINSSCYNNKIGVNFTYNKIYNTFNNNLIGNDFQNNYMNLQFYRNDIGNSFQNNLILFGSYIGAKFQNNEIGNKFNNNTIIGNFFGNNIGGGFNNNSIDDGFYGNNIGFGFNNNIIGTAFGSNLVEYYFNYNTVGNVTQYNHFKPYFSNNVFGDELEYNNFGSNIYNITAISYFKYNTISDNLNGVDFSLSTLVYDTTMDKTIFKIQGGVYKLSYYDSSAVLQIATNLTD